jgi:AcrR family transcriptional regulator
MASHPAPEPTRPRGRPRRPELDRAILNSALGVLSERGFSGASVEQVAKRAGVGKPTIYRRYDGKLGLFTAAIATAGSRLEEPIDTGSALGDLMELGRRIQEIGEVGLFGALLVEAQRNPPLLELYRRQVIDPRRDGICQILKRGIEQGEICPDVDSDLVIDAISGACLVHYVARGQPDENWAERIVKLLWRGIAAEPGDCSEINP